MVVGLNHHSTPVELREQFAFSDDSLDGALSRLVDTETIREGAILSTCNRVEVVARTPNLDAASEKICNFLAAEQQVTRSRFENYLYTHVNRDAVRQARVEARVRRPIVPCQDGTRIRAPYEIGAAFMIQTHKARIAEGPRVRIAVCGHCRRPRARCRSTRPARAGGARAA